MVSFPPNAAYPDLGLVQFFGTQPRRKEHGLGSALGFTLGNARTRAVKLVGHGAELSASLALGLMPFLPRSASKQTMLQATPFRRNRLGSRGLGSRGLVSDNRVPRARTEMTGEPWRTEMTGEP